MIPPNLTEYLQPPNLSVNKSFNNFVTVQYNSWYGEKVKDIDPNDPNSAGDKQHLACKSIRSF